MFELTATVRNGDGIHCRPSATIIKAVAGYAGEVSIHSDRGRSDLRSVIALMTLALLPGDMVSIRVTGPDEESVCRQIAALFETHFDFPPRPPGSPLPIPPGMA
jgi:phosphotransferase system HPr (HPr) family protein